MTQLHPVTVRILDKDYHVACPAAERANLESAARFLDGKMREIRDAGKIFGLERIAVLAALNISYEMLQAQPGNSGSERAPREQVGDLLERIDRQLHGDDPALRRQQQRQIQQQAGTQRSLPPTPQVEAPQARVQQQAHQLQQSRPPQAQAPQPEPVSRPTAPWEQPAAAQGGWSPQLDAQPGLDGQPIPPQDPWQLAPEPTFQPAPEQNSWQDGPLPDFMPPQDNWQDPSQGSSVQNPVQPQGHWQHGEENPPAGSGFLDGGPDFQLPPQQR